jgi:AcrR family transcriptional regulator
MASGAAGVSVERALHNMVSSCTGHERRGLISTTGRFVRRIIRAVVLFVNTTGRAILFDMPMAPGTHAKVDGRQQRADGARSRDAILQAATELATVEGLDGLSIGRLAERVGMSKSGLFAHFRSKEDLQLATIDAAAEMFDREVWQPGRAAPAGARRVLSLCEAFFSYLERAVFPGGCFFVAAAAELDAKPGPVRDHLREVYSRILEGLAGAVREAQGLGEIDAAEDVAQLTFELDSLMLGANFAYVFFADRAALGRARLAIRQRLARAAPRAAVKRARLQVSERPRRRRKRHNV